MEAGARSGGMVRSHHPSPTTTTRPLVIPPCQPQASPVCEAPPAGEAPPPSPRVPYPPLLPESRRPLPPPTPLPAAGLPCWPSAPADSPAGRRPPLCAKHALRAKPLPAAAGLPCVRSTPSGRSPSSLAEGVVPSTTNPNTSPCRRLRRLPCRPQAFPAPHARLARTMRTVPRRRKRALGSQTRKGASQGGSAGTQLETAARK